MKKNVTPDGNSELFRKDHVNGGFDLWQGEAHILLDRNFYRPCPPQFMFPLWPYYFIENRRRDRQWYKHVNFPNLSVTLVLAGRIKYTEDQRCVIAGPGEVRIGLPGNSDLMVNADNNATSKLVVLFNGCAKHSFAQMFGIYSSGKLQLKNPAPVEKKMRRIGALIRTARAGTEFELAEAGYALWLELMRQKKALLYPAAMQTLLQKLQQKKFILSHEETLSGLSGLSGSTVLRLFHRCFGCSPHAFLLRQRLQIAASLLGSGISIKETAMQCGFSDAGYFSRCFKRQFGSTPSVFSGKPVL